MKIFLHSVQNALVRGWFIRYDFYPKRKGRSLSHSSTVGNRTQISTDLVHLVIAEMLPFLLQFL